MGELFFKNKYRIPSIRLRDYDYSQNGWYFITICIKNRKEECFGQVLDNEMQLSALGREAQKCWQEIPSHFPFVYLDEYVVMPNHVHGILKIDNDPVSPSDIRLGTQNFVNNIDVGGVVVPGVETQNFASLHHVTSPPNDLLQYRVVPLPNNTIRPYKNKFGPQSKNISSIIRGFKIGVTKYARNNNIVFMWQERFYDRIVSNQFALEKIRQYIINNPAKWSRDRNKPTGIFI